MARRKLRRSKRNNVSADKSAGYYQSSFLSGIKEETKNTAWAIGLFILATFLVLANFNIAGPVGQLTYTTLIKLLGQGFFLLPLTIIFMAVSFLRDNRPHFAKWRFLAGFIAFLALLASAEIIYTNAGGWLGQILALPLTSAFDQYLSLVMTTAIVLLSSLVLFDTHLTLDGKLFGWHLWGKKEDGLEEDEEILDLEAEDDVETIMTNLAKEEKNEPIKTVESSPLKPAPVAGLSSFISIPRSRGDKPFTPPPLSLLANDSGRPGVGDIKANANIIKRTLANFGITVEMDEVSIGPSITRYAFKPAEGVRLSRIITLQRDLELALAAHPIRIEAPIPGKSLVGIELPNSTKTLVGLGSLLSSESFARGQDPLLISLGRGISGEPSFARLSKAPHLLIAGSTGSGKSVTIHTIITSLLYRQPPDNMRFIMIDPKRVELTLYNKIPHLLTPVITDPKKAIMALRWAAGEMDRRYNILEAEAVRDIESYHKNVLAKKIEEEEVERMPYIVIIIDELADIMSTYPRELEAAIVRLAQMSRAVGIHLIISTQRPSVEIITGLIKANIPTRIALQVASQIDSRTILDMAGAEKLLGAGDMLYLGGEMSKPIRLQSAFISEEEVKKVTNYLVQNYEAELPALNLNDEPANGGQALFSTALDNGDDDDLYEEARQAVMEAGKASASYLQRKLKVGYARAARLIDMLEERGIVGPGEGAKPREIRGEKPPENYGELAE
ncbi:MAG: DNA translocase FtsK [bacterium]|nr:DNA translocase FtsK [bacterium]